MRVARWGNSLAVRLPKRLVDTLCLKEGDELELTPSGKMLAVRKDDQAAEFLQAMERFRFPLPPGYRFDREEANER